MMNHIVSDHWCIVLPVADIPSQDWSAVLVSGLAWLADQLCREGLTNQSDLPACQDEDV